MSDEKADKKKLNIVKTFFRLLPKAFKASPRMFVFSQALLTLSGISFAVITKATQVFFDSAAQFTQKKISVTAMILSLLLLGGAHLFNQLMNGISNFFPMVYAEKAGGKLSSEIHKKMGRLSAADFEDTEMLDDINKAEQGKSNAIWFVFIFILIFTFYLPYFAFMSYYLFSFKPILAAGIVVIFIPTALSQLIRTKVFTKLEDKSAPIRRQTNHYENCIAARDYFKETRILGAYSFFRKLYLDSMILQNKLKFQAGVKTNLYELAMKTLTVCGYFGVVYLLFDTLMKREITVGAFSAVFASLGMLVSIMEEMVCRQFGTLAQNLGTIRNYLNFMDMKERQGADTDLPENAEIHIKNVSFSYPGAKSEAVTDVSFTIGKNETIAIVGENGSGKSTLIRLISGIYLPSCGDIFYGDKNTRDISMRSIFKNISAVFQRYQKYQLTLRNNITISQTEAAATVEMLDGISEMSGICKDDACFTDGYETMLSREFDGVDLSGGQWQRVSIARGLFRRHDLIILDEPTAAIDPLEETKIYNRFARISKGKTAIIVTHRLGSVRLADRIAVMDKGRLAEIGTHDELMQNNGEYARLYSAQEQWYR